MADEDRDLFKADLAATGATWWLVQEAFATTRLGRVVVRLNDPTPEQVAQARLANPAALISVSFNVGPFTSHADDAIGMYRNNVPGPLTCDRCGRHLPCRHCPEVGNDGLTDEERAGFLDQWRATYANRDRTDTERCCGHHHYSCFMGEDGPPFPCCDNCPANTRRSTREETP